MPCFPDLQSCRDGDSGYLEVARVQIWSRSGPGPGPNQHRLSGRRPGHPDEEIPRGPGPTDELGLESHLVMRSGLTLNSWTLTLNIRCRKS